MSWLRTAKSVAWSFVGLRSRDEFEKDMQQINPLHWVAVAFAGVALFVAALMAIVNWVAKA